MGIEMIGGTGPRERQGKMEKSVRERVRVDQSATCASPVVIGCQASSTGFIREGTRQALALQRPQAGTRTP